MARIFASVGALVQEVVPGWPIGIAYRHGAWKNRGSICHQGCAAESMPTLRQIEYWVAAVEEGSFGRAARRMHVSQPSLSQQVKVLEAELGGELLQRLPGGIRLTAAGREFLPHAREAVASAREAMRAARAALELRGGELEIATVPSIAAGILSDLVGMWRER